MSDPRIIDITLDERTILWRNADIEQERKVALFDILNDNHFKPLRPAPDGYAGPYKVALRVEEGRLAIDIQRADGSAVETIGLGMMRFRRAIKDYFAICDSYYQAVRQHTPQQIETVDMARRGLHNDAAELLRERLDGKIELDFDTARRLFTLICAVQPFASRIDERESTLPTVLFVCSMNSVRSPIAAALARRFFPGRLIVRSAGVRSGKADGFVHEVMEEIGVDMSVHTPHTMDELVANHFDLVITLSNDAPEAVERRGLEMGASEHWPMPDPTETEGNREAVLSAYRTLRDTLQQRVRERLEKLVAAPTKAA